MNDNVNDNVNDNMNDDTRKSEALPRELKFVARALDARATHMRDELSEQALERIFAASDMQLPLGEYANSAPIAGRITRATNVTGTNWVTRALRIAAAVAVVAGLTGVTIALVRGYVNPVVPGMEPGGALVQAPEIPAAAPLDVVARNDSSVNPVMTPRITPALTPDHLDQALSAAFVTQSAANSTSAMIVALADGNVAAVTQFASIAERGSDFELDLDATTYDDLSGEISAILAAPASPH
jgi:hypothetical protein